MRNEFVNPSRPATLTGRKLTAAMIIALAVTTGTGSAWAQPLNAISSVTIGGQTLEYSSPKVFVKSETANFGIYDLNRNAPTSHEVYGTNVYAASNGITFKFKNEVKVDTIPNIFVGQAVAANKLNNTEYTTDVNANSIRIHQTKLQKGDTLVDITFNSKGSTRVAVVRVIPAAKTVTTVKGKTGEDSVSLSFANNNGAAINPSPVKYDDFWGQQNGSPGKHIEFWEYGASHTMKVISVPGAGKTAARSLKIDGKDTTSNVAGNDWTIPLTQSAVYDVTVEFILSNDALAAKVKEWLTADLIRNNNANLTSVTSPLSLPTNCVDVDPGVTITWSSNNTAVVGTDGNVTRPNYGDGDKAVTLTAAIYRNGVSDSIGVKTFSVTVKQASSPQTELVETVKNSLTWDVIRGSNASADAITGTLILPRIGSFAGTAYRSVAISWESSDASVIRVKAGSAVDSGVVTRAADESRKATLTARVSMENADDVYHAFSDLSVLRKSPVQPNDISFGNYSVVYNRKPQSAARASLSPVTAATYTSNGTDRFDTAYTYVMVSDADGETVDDGVPTRVAPTDVGEYTVTVTWENRNYYGTKDAKFTIAKKPLTASMLFVDSLTAYTYSKSFIHPGYHGVTDGGEPLVFGRDFEGAYGLDSVFADHMNAGTKTAIFSVRGVGNYTGQAFRNFSIAPKTISVDAENSVVAAREYNGVTPLDGDSVTVAFAGLERGDELVSGSDYTFTAANGGNTLNYNHRDVALANRVTGTVRLLETATAKNYRLSGAGFSTSAWMVKRVADESDFAYRIDTVLYTGVARPQVSVAFKSGLTNSGGTLTALYDGEESAVPVEIGEYLVSVRVTGGTNYEDGDVDLGWYVINDPEKPKITAQPADTTARAGGTAYLSVTAVSPNDGYLSYQWYRNDTLVSGAVNAIYTIPVTEAMVGASLQYHVVVENSKAGVQVPVSVASDKARLTVKSAPRSIAGARVEVSGGPFDYDGNAKTPGVAVTLNGLTLQAAANYTLSYSDNVNAGNVVVTVTGVDDYAGQAFGSFVIGKKRVAREDLDIVNRTAQYDGEPLPAEVALRNDLTGLGTVSVRYNNSATVPVNVGDYTVAVNVADNGRNFTGTGAGAAGFDLGEYKIVKAQPAPDNFVYTIPTDHRWTGAPQGIGNVAIKGTGYGKLEVLYDADATLPVEIGTYRVFASITGGDNYLSGIVLLGEYTIADTTTSVASGGRAIPAGGAEETVVVTAAPTGAFAGKLAAGPNPARRGGSTTFFWEGKALSDGKLLVFDAAGNLVKNIAVSDKSVAGGSVAARQAESGKRKAASWDLRDSKGRPVPEGTYLVKGALATKDGGRVRVSLMLGVW